MADSSEVDKADGPVQSNSGGDIVDVDDKKPRIMKRGRAGIISSSTDNSEDSEPDEKRPAFRLQPPTLIHGKAKPVPKSDEGPVASSSKCKFLQPSKLTAISSSAGNAPVTKASQVNNDLDPVVSSSNPFLLMAEKDANEESKEVETHENQEESSAAEIPKINGNGLDEAKPDSTTEVDTKEKNSERSDENLFSQASSSNATFDKTGMGGFVFGSKMEDRVVINNDSKSPDKDSGDGSSDSNAGFVFGQNLSERAMVSSTSDGTPPSFLPASNEASGSAADSSTPNESNSQDTDARSPSTDKKVGLEEDAAAHFLASQSRPKMPEIEVLTGEEDEKNVLQIQCKLHQFDSLNQNWLERGVGSLHLNDGKYSEDSLRFQSRLVMRVHGSLRLVLNTKIWPSMTVERASKKSVRVSAQTDDGSIGVFLITGTINDAEQIFRALEYRVLHQKQLEEKRNALEKEDIVKEDDHEDTSKAENGESKTENNEAICKNNKQDKEVEPIVEINNKKTADEPSPSKDDQPDTTQDTVESTTSESVLPPSTEEDQTPN